MTDHPNYIDGEWVTARAGATFDTRNPANLDEVTGRWPALGRAETAAAIAAAATAFPAWRRLGAYGRAAILQRALAAMRARREEIAAVVTLENGKTLAESRAEIDSAINEMEFQIHEGMRLGGETLPTRAPGVFAYSTRCPLGVVSVISPWNFPFNVPCRKATPALMAGNTVVFKPASLTPHTGLKFCELLIEAGVPRGVLNMVTGGGATVGEELIANPAIKAISFTGSTGVGRHIQTSAAPTMARTQLELGGKNPLVVLADADLEQAAKAAVTAAYACAGQWCTSTSRAIVERPVAAEFIDRVVAGARALVVGDGRDPATTMGPLCGADQLASVSRYLEIGRAEGATLLTGGGRPPGTHLARGCFLEPTVFGDVEPAMTIAREEVFGPVLSVIVAADFEAALEIANGVEFGLSSSIFTRDLEKAFRFLEGTDVGLAHVNMLTAYKEPQLSFGGVKASGFGVPEAGTTGLEFFTEHKVAYVKFGG